MRASCHVLLSSLTAVLGLVVVSCKRERSAPKPVMVEVTSDTGQIDAARKAWADGREQKLTELLQGPESIRSYDKESIELVRQQRERSVAALERLRDDRSKLPQTRIHAIYALRFLEVSPSSEQLSELGRINEEAAAALLLELQVGDAYRNDQPLPNALKRFVIDCIGSKDPRVRTAAAHLAGSRKLSEAGDAILQRTRQEHKPDAAFLKAAARLRPSVEILERLQQQLKPEGWSTSSALGAIADLSEATQDAALREKAARVCADYLQQQPNQPWIDADAMFAVEVIAAVQPPEAARSLLQNLIRSAQWRLVRETALQRLEKNDAKLAGQLAAETGVKFEGEAAKSESRARSLSAQQIADICTRHALLTPAEAQRAVTE